MFICCSVYFAGKVFWGGSLFTDLSFAPSIFSWAIASTTCFCLEDLFFRAVAYLLEHGVELLVDDCREENLPAQFRFYVGNTSPVSFWRSFSRSLRNRGNILRISGRKMIASSISGLTTVVVTAVRLKDSGKG